jgi:hypothetical protein
MSAMDQERVRALEAQAAMVGLTFLPPEEGDDEDGFFIVDADPDSEDQMYFASVDDAAAYLESPDVLVVEVERRLAMVERGLSGVRGDLKAVRGILKNHRAGGEEA